MPALGTGQGPPLGLPEEPREPSLRQRLLELVRRRPGVRMSTLWRALGTDRGSATYHLNVLERAREIEALRTKRLTRFYPKETPDGERGAIAVLRHGRVQDVARLVRSRPGIAQHEITHTLPITRKVFRRYANLLIACDLLQETVRDQDRHYFPTPRLILLLEALGEGNTYGGRP